MKDSEFSKDYTNKFMGTDEPSKGDYWTWYKIHTLGRNSLDGGVRMVCERLAGKVAINIKLTKQDIQQLDRIEFIRTIR